MKAITFSNPGGPEVLRLTDLPDPHPGPGQLLVRVRATALNRADLLQRRGHYPPPPGESDILGLELAGEIEAVGESVEGFVSGDRVCALVGGGGYAEKAVVDHRLAMPIPDGWSFAEAAAVPESFLTAHDSLVTLGGLAAGEVVLIHAAGSGLGTASVQMARHAGARVLATAGTADKLALACELGAEAGCNYKERDFADWVKELTDGRGVDLIQDPVGAAFWERNFRCLREKGRLVVLGLLGGSKAEVDLGLLLRKRVTVMGTVLRQRSLDEKAALVRRFQELWLPALARGDLRPVIDSVFSLEQAAEAHRYMESNRNMGKIVLAIPAKTNA